MPKREPHRVGDILNSLKKTTPLGESLEQASVWSRWEEIAGASLAAHGRPHSMKEGQLRIEVDSPVWMHRYAYQKWRIIKRINQLARRELVHDLYLALLPDGDTLDEGEDVEGGAAD